MSESNETAALTWQQIAVHKRWDAAAKSQLQPELPMMDFVVGALENGRFGVGDLIWILSQGLPPRCAVWWACLCVEHARQGALSEAEGNALQAAAAWVVEPTPNHRLVAEFAGKLGESSPHFCAMAAGYFGAVADDVWKQVEPETAGGIVQTAVLFAIEEARAKGMTLTDRQCILFGVQVAKGEFAWTN